MSSIEQLSDEERHALSEKIAASSVRVRMAIQDLITREIMGLNQPQVALQVCLTVIASAFSSAVSVTRMMDESLDRKVVEDAYIDLLRAGLNGQPGAMGEVLVKLFGEDVVQDMGNASERKRGMN